MGIRREARELALTYLYQIDLGVENMESATMRIDGEHKKSARVKNFAKHIVLGVWRFRKEIDELISRHLLRWKPERLTRTDRALLRMAVYEMKFDTDVPSKVAINEAVEIGKKFGGNESGRFLNGVLDAIFHSKCADSN